jgi:hypothetical protein
MLPSDALATHLEEFTTSATEMSVSLFPFSPLSSLPGIRLQHLNKKFTKVRRSIKSLRRYYGDDVEETKDGEDAGQIFFQIFTDFANQYSKVLKDRWEWNEQVWVPLPWGHFIALLILFSRKRKLCIG